MNLGFFDRFKDDNKESKIKNLFENMTDFIEEKFTGKDLGIHERKEISLLQEVQDANKVTTTYRDKMLIERSNILNDYAKATFEKGTMYFVYSKNSSKDNAYNLCICENGMNSKVITVEEFQLPKNAGVDSILRLDNGKYILDERATEDIYSQMSVMTQRLLDEQTNELVQRRIEGNVYEVVEVSGDMVSIMNTTKNDGYCFEEICISNDVLSELCAGDSIQYLNGQYCRYNK